MLAPAVARTQKLQCRNSAYEFLQPSLFDGCGINHRARHSERRGRLFWCVCANRSPESKSSAQLMLWNAATRWVAIKLNHITTYSPPPPRAPDDAEPRRVLVVHAHPAEDSFSAALASAVEVGAKEGGHSVRRRSLYEEGYTPALSARERANYFDTASGASRFPPETQSHLDDLRWCNSLVVVYPTWWFNLPAILKGYFDRTMVPGPDGAWDFPNGHSSKLVASNGLVPRLTNVERVLGVSTYGASKQITMLAGDNGRNWCAPLLCIRMMSLDAISLRL